MSSIPSRLFLISFLAFLLCAFKPVVAVKHENFKTCEQSGFCKRNRAFADRASAKAASTSAYHLDSRSIALKAGQLQGTILKSLGEGIQPVRLPLSIFFLESGVVRLVVDEEKRQKGEIELRHGSPARKERYNELSEWILVGGLDVNKKVDGTVGKEETIVPYGPKNQYKAIVRHSPFAVDFIRDGHTHVKFNANGFLNFEHWRSKVDTVEEEGARNADVLEDEGTFWEETFGGNTDSKPKGPESIGLDITFPGYEHVFGIPGHATPLSLKETRGGTGNYDQPYRMYNSDVFEYEMDSPMTLYGAIPFMQAHKKDSAVGVLWFNAAETWVDIVKTKASSNPLSLGIGAKTDTQTHWFSENGLLDVFVFLGPTPKDVIGAYADLTGYTALPQHFSLGYHQCRWNYVTDEDAKDVDRKFDRNQIPYDSIWLDIEYTDDRKYFTWDSHNFPDPISIQTQLDKHERKLVIIVDPHIKNIDNYPVVDELKSKGLAVKGKDGTTVFEGWCWPGSSHWIDGFNPAAVKWWTRLFSYSSFKGTTPSTFLWNDMNEPSVFNGPETTMPKDNIHHGNWEHRDIHNLNGLTIINATYTALLNRDPKSPRRPFVLTRSFFAGSQRLGAMWTGDNVASWSHLAASIPMVLSQNIAGFPFAGADVGGFFGEPSHELLARWYEAGAFYPFMRAHSHIETRRREPYLIGEPYTGVIAKALRLRYQLLPAWYTAFHEASVSGAPIVRPHYYVHPEDEAAFAIDDQFYIGSTGLLSKPVITEGAETVDVYLPAGHNYFDYFDYTTYVGEGKTVTLSAPLGKIPLLMHAGHIIPRRDRPRRSSALMRWDPFTLLIVVGSNGKAEGTLYLDDGESFEYEEGAFIHRKFILESSSSSFTLASFPISSTSSKLSIAYHKKMENVRVEKIIFVNAPRAWEKKTQVSIKEDGKADRVVRFRYEVGSGRSAAWAVVRDPAVGVGRGWEIGF